MTNRHLVFFAVVVAAAMGPRSAEAQSGQDRALAESLFRDARGLMAAGDYATACPKLGESERLDPKLGTILNLALCHQKLGRTASAWAEYTQAAELAARSGQRTREDFARKAAATLEAEIPHLVIHAPSSDLKVTLDGEVVGAAALGTDLPVDPGDHEVKAEAQGFKPWSTKVTIAAGHATETVDIAPLAPIAVIEPPSRALETPPAPPLPPPSRSQRTLGYALLTAGGVAIATGFVFGGVALAEKGAAEGQCSATKQCTESGLSDLRTMQVAEATSTLTITAGLLAAGAGIFFVLRKGREGKVGSLEVRPLLGSASGAALSGAF